MKLPGVFLLSFFSVQHPLHLSYHTIKMSGMSLTFFTVHEASCAPSLPLFLAVSRYSLPFAWLERGEDPNKTTAKKLWASFIYIPVRLSLLQLSICYLQYTVCTYKILQHIWPPIWLRKWNNFSFLSGFARNCFISRPKAYYYWDSDKILAHIFTRPPAENRISPFYFSESMEEASDEN